LKWLLHPVFVVVIAVVVSDAGKDDILRQFINASELAQQVKLMRLVSLLLAVYLSFLPRNAMRIWNSLPENVVTAATLQSFKKHLKTFSLQRSYSIAL